MSHTPGPWRICQRGAVVSDHAGGHHLDQDSIEFYGGPYLIAESIIDTSDATLIAAATDLLEVAKSALEILTTYLSPCDRDCECILHPLRAAVAKAQGVTPLPAIALHQTSITDPEQRALDNIPDVEKGGAA